MNLQLSPPRASLLLLLAARNVGTLRALGDLPGHPFHGNQYVDATASEADFHRLGDLQRGEPERAMERVQMALGGGVLNPVVEHVGDLTHRMTDRATFQTAGYGAVKDSVDRALQYLKSPYHFRRELEQNITANAAFHQVDPVAYRERVFNALRDYANAHAKLPVYNEAQQRARDAAVAIGRGRYEDAVRHLNVLAGHLGSQARWVEYAHRGLKLARPERVRSPLETTISEHLKLIGLGDLPGHPFHGNQWTDGTGQTEAPFSDTGGGAVSSVVPRLSDAIHRAVAKDHRANIADSVKDELKDRAKSVKEFGEQAAGRIWGTTILEDWDAKTIQEYEDKVEATMDRVVPNAKVFVRMNVGDLQNVLASGEIQNAFQSGKSHGGLTIDKYPDTGRHAAAEELLFGIPTTAPGTARPKYGYLSSGDGISELREGVLKGAGGVAVELRETVRSRTTFTIGDSTDNAVTLMPEGLGGGFLTNGRSFIPQPMLRPSLLAAPGGIVDWPTDARWAKARAVTRVEQLNSDGYVEAQVHGRVGLGDIKRVTFTTSPSKAVRQLLMRKEIPWRVAKQRRALGDYLGHPFHGNQYTEGYSLPPSSDDPAPGGRYMYHATSLKHLPAIVEQGIVGRHGLVSLSPHLDSVHTWAGLIGHGEQTVLLRTPRAGLSLREHDQSDEGDAYDPRDLGAETGTWRPIRPNRLEVYHEGRWKPLMSLRGAGDYEGHPFHGNQYADVAGGGPASRTRYVVDAHAEGQAILDRARQQPRMWPLPTTDEERRQDVAARANASPLARPKFVLGLDNDMNGAARRYVAAYGREFASAPRPADVAQGELKACYKNASLLVLEREGLDYAEGWAKTKATGDLVFAHAWAVTKDGTVVDPTWRDGHSYFGVRYARAPYLAQLYKAKKYGVLGGDLKVAQRVVATGGMKLRVLGGAGSGNFGHAGRPGEVGGSAPAGQTLDKPGVTDALRMRLSGREELALAQNLNVLRAAAARVDFPPDKVRIESYDKAFAVGGQEFTEAGHFSAATGEIVFRAEALARSGSQDAEAMFLHEVAHRDWNDVKDALGLEAGAPDVGIDFAGTPGAVHAEAIQALLTDHGEQLQREDGITPYSRAYWSEVPVEHNVVAYNDQVHPWLDRTTGQLYKTKPTFEIDEDEYNEKFARATNETLAEIRKVELLRAFGRHDVDVYDPTPRWRALHDSVRDLAKEVRRMKRERKSE